MALLPFRAVGLGLASRELMDHAMGRHSQPPGCGQVAMGY